MRTDGANMLKLKLLRTLNESQSRWYVASEAVAMGRGGIEAMHQLTGKSGRISVTTLPSRTTICPLATTVSARFMA